MKKVLLWMAGVLLLSACMNNKGNDDKIQYSGNQFLRGGTPIPKGLYIMTSIGYFPLIQTYTRIR